MDINMFKLPKSKYNKNVVEKIINDVEEQLKRNVGALHLAISKDNSTYSETEGYSKLISTINNIRKEDWIMDKTSNTTVYEGIGNIAVVASCQPEICLYMLLKALKTNNNVMFFVEDRIHDTSKKIIEIVREICKKNNYNFSSDYVEYKSIGQLCEYSDYFNLYVFIDKLDYYLKFKSKVHNNLIYSSYGKMSLYMDDKDLKDELSQMDKFVFDNNINLDLIKEVPVQEAVERINKNLDNYCVVIFTKDTKKAYYFIENVKAKQIFVNKNPYMNYKFDIDEEKLVIRKRIYI